MANIKSARKRARQAEMGLDSLRVEEELEDRTHAPRVREDIRSGERSGVTGTPTFFINGVRIDGGLRPEYLDAAIELELKKAAVLNN